MTVRAYLLQMNDILDIFMGYKICIFCFFLILIERVYKVPIKAFGIKRKQKQLKYVFYSEIVIS
jgi:hypothetical protein